MSAILEEDICRECGGKCCSTPHFMARELSRMVRALGPERVFEKLKSLPLAEPEQWFTFTEGCAALGENGCDLSPDDRPIVCQLYPLEPLKYKEGWRILLDVRNCPAWRTFGGRYGEAEDSLKE
jgi:Fe-S-cluster containining protein